MSIDLPASCPSLSLPFADDEAHEYRHGSASSTSPGASLRPKLLFAALRLLRALGISLFSSSSVLSNSDVEIDC